MKKKLTKSKNELPFLLSGANGFTGRFVCQDLIKKKIKFIALLRPNSNCSWLKEKKIEIRYADLSNAEQLGKSLNGCCGLINLASIGFGTVPTIIEACEKNNIKRVIFFSTTAIYTSLPAKSKSIRLDAEKLIKKSNLIWTIVRPTMIYGTKEDRNMIKLIRWIKKYPFIPIFGKGKNLQQPINVRDVSWFVCKILNEKDSYFKEFNISGYKAKTFIEIINCVEKELSKKIFKLYLPYKIFINIFKFFEIFGFKFFIKAEQIQRLNEDKNFSYDKAKKYFGFKPMPFELGIKAEILLLKKFKKISHYEILLKDDKGNWYINKKFV